MIRHKPLMPGLRSRPLKVLTAAQMKELDRRAISEVGIPALSLMENAGRAVAEAGARMFLSRKGTTARGYICIVCGNGNNGGDGLVAARHLLNQGFKAVVLAVGDLGKASPGFAVNYRALRELKMPISRPDSAGLRALRRSGLVIDALLGVGLSRPVEGDHLRAVEAVNASRIPVLAVDVPSGLDATTGRVWGACVKAAATVTLAYPKKGLFIAEGPRYAGRVTVADIGIPYSLPVR